LDDRSVLEPSQAPSQAENQGQTLGTSTDSEFAPAPELKPTGPLVRHDDPIPGEIFGEQVPPDAPRTTEEKLASPDWPAQLAAKQPKKAEQGLIAEANPATVPTASPGMVERQEQFLDILRQRQTELDALDPVTREQVYDDLKRKELGE
jgi:hypothetical protein